MEKRRLTPQPNMKFRRGVRMFYAWVGSTVILGVGPILAMRLVESSSTPVRVAGVALGVGSMLPWIWVVAGIIRGSDEFLRRLHLVALAFAFFGSLMLVVVLDWLVRAEFMAPPDFILVWAAFLVIWLVALVVTKRYFERVP